MTDAIKGALCMSLFGVLWAVIELLGGSLSSDYSPYQVVWSRYLVHILLSLAAMLALRHSLSVRTGLWRVQLLRSSTMLVMPVAFVAAMHAGPAGSVWSMVWLAPLLAMAAGRWLQGTALRGTDWAAAALCFAGAALVWQPGVPLSLQSAAWALAAAASLAAYLILTTALRADSVWLSLFYTALVPLVALSFLMPALWAPVSLRFALVCLTIGATGWVALLALDKAIRLLMPAYAAVFVYVEVVMDALLVRGLDEAITALATGILICGLTWAAIRTSRRQQAGSRRPAA
jgi:drug/metabolite transporter (DMT)-like permease